MTTALHDEPDAKPERLVRRAVYAIAAMFVLAVITLVVLNAITAARIRRINDRGGLVKSWSTTVFAPIVYPFGYTVVNWHEENFVLRQNYEVYFGDTDVAIGCGSGVTMWSAPTHEIDSGDDGVLAAKDLNGINLLSFLHTSVTDGGLMHLREMRSLEVLDLGWTNVRGPGLGYLRNMSLSSLSLHNDPVDDVGLASLPEMPSLTSLDLGGTRITSASVPRLLGYRALTSLDLTGTKITDDDVRALGELRLRYLVLRDTPITDAALQYIEKMPDLNTVHLCGTRVTAEAASRSSRAVQDWLLMKNNFCKQFGHDFRR
jgi:Leucine Rich repeat